MDGCGDILLGKKCLPTPLPKNFREGSASHRLRSSGDDGRESRPGVLGPAAPPCGGRWQWDRNSLFASTDPVALDAVCLDIIQEKRRSNPECIPVVDLFETRRRPVHIADAAQMGLGTADRHRIDWARVAQD